ncbi:hypothetical protein DPEC_G00244830 [Dallia pectoralis]|uniref:Uncharacterized protein n=1 Tax=Dallia pectoralis TaxID=75939 RepID=A0ACC2FVM6_DALPE|nr:hypothetical protein DPEC_G00244830 [Dallia pectoralis]
MMSYYMDPVSSYPALHLCDRLGAMRQSGGVALGLQTQLPGVVVQPQQYFPPSTPLYPQDVTLQEVPNGHDLVPTGWMRGHRGYGGQSATVVFSHASALVWGFGSGWI